MKLCFTKLDVLFEMLWEVGLWFVTLARAGRFLAMWGGKAIDFPTTFSDACRFASDDVVPEAFRLCVTVDITQCSKKPGKEKKEERNPRNKTLKFNGVLVLNWQLEQEIKTNPRKPKWIHVI